MLLRISSLICHFLMATFDLKLLYRSTSCASRSLSVKSAAVSLKRCSAISFSKRRLICKASLAIRCRTLNATWERAGTTKSQVFCRQDAFFLCRSEPWVLSCIASKLLSSRACPIEMQQGRFHMSLIAGSNGKIKSWKTSRFGFKCFKTSW